MQAVLQLAEKQGSWGGVNTIRPGNLIFIKDQASDIGFLVDTGASVSLLPGPVDPSPDAPSLAAANGTCIAMVCVQQRHLLFSNSAAAHHSFCWDFLVDDVSSPILGNDFLQAQVFCVDSAACCLRRHDSCFPGTSSFS